MWRPSCCTHPKPWHDSGNKVNSSKPNEYWLPRVIQTSRLFCLAFTRHAILKWEIFTGLKYKTAYQCCVAPHQILFVTVRQRRCNGEGGPHVTITHDALDLTIHDPPPDMALTVQSLGGSGGASPCNHYSWCIGPPHTWPPSRHGTHCTRVSTRRERVTRTSTRNER